MSDFRMDEAGLFLERQLEFIRPQIFEVALTIAQLGE